jgi:glycosyltransferase involved in cell wall biosynthesis
LGVAPNEKIVEAECKATLLINPRFTTEEFTKYSFPSKNMEYMASGTPLLTTKLPGMPEEYYPYVFLFEEETLEGFAYSISNVLGKTDDELKHLGMTARDFVLKNKNNVFQANRIVEFIKNDL